MNMEISRTGYHIGVDVGGTFTDIVCIGGDGRTIVRKVPSSADDYARAIVECLQGLLEEAGIAPEGVVEVRHGATVASNAILEGRGAKTGLIATEGFRDILEIRSLRMPRLYDLAWRKPPPLVERHLRLTVAERMTHEGKVQLPLERGDAAAAVGRLLGEGVEAIAVALLHSYANPVHEEIVEAEIRRLAPDLAVSVSHKVLPEAKEYERTSTTVVDAYLKPVVSRYLRGLGSGLERVGIRTPLLLMQSSGGLIGMEAAAEAPVQIVESGPAGGVIGAQALAAAAGLADIITFDMGGTTAKASIVERGEVSRALEFSVGAGVLSGSRLLTGAGYVLKTPAIDLAEVGAGGGSLLRLDAAGSLLAGPESAGADPGPVCYGLGGTEPTVTDANVVLGYLNPELLVGGAVRLDAGKARGALGERIAGPMGLPVEEAAYGAHRIAASNMIRAIRAVSSERGRDPRDYALFAFGGNGPLFGAGMARDLGIGRMVVPPSPGLFSSFGLLHAKVEHHLSKAHRCILDVADSEALRAAWKELEMRADAQLAADGFAPEARQCLRSAQLHYHGQVFELQVPAPPGRIGRAWLDELAEAFAAEHENTYGHRAGPDEPVELMTIQVTGQGLDSLPVRPAEPSRRPAGGSLRKAYFGREDGWREVPVLGRADLGSSLPGPLIVEEYDSTCLVPPRARAGLDRFGNIVIDL